MRQDSEDNGVRVPTGSEFFSLSTYLDARGLFRILSGLIVRNINEILRLKTGKQNPSIYTYRTTKYLIPILKINFIPTYFEFES